MSVIEAKARQCAKIQEICAALIAEGLLSVEEQAEALGLSRSTAWVLSKGHHKTSGLTAGLLKKILSSPTLPAAARIKIQEYIQEKAAGLYGHHLQLRRRFVAQLESSGTLASLSLPHNPISTASNSSAVRPHCNDENAVSQMASRRRRDAQ
jgi:hypothetical protein